MQFFGQLFGQIVGRRARRRWTCLRLVPLLLGTSLAGPGHADVLSPRSGKTVHGAIVSESDAEVVFNIYWSTNPGVTNPEHIVRLPRGKVKKAERRPHPEVEVFRRLQAAKPDDVEALVSIGQYAKDNRLKAHAKMCFALALSKNDAHKEALKGIGGRGKWESERKGNPLLDAELQGLIERYVAMEDAEERSALQRAIKERGFKAKPHDLERYRRSVHQATGLQVDRPISYRSDARPGAVYTLFVPKTYTPTRPWPLIIGLHGGGADGKQGDEVVGSGPSAMMFYQSQAARHGYLVACPTALMAGWGNKPNEEYVRDLITELKLLYHIDIDRVYMTGHSMGGFGTWALGPRMAEDLAAISPMAGAGSGVGRLTATRTPIFIYHSDNDYVSVSSDRAAAKQLLGGDLDFIYTELPGKGHAFPPSIQSDLFTFFGPRRRYDKSYKRTWPRSSFLGKPGKDEVSYLGDPMAAIKGTAPGLKTWLAHLRLGGGRALAAVGCITEAHGSGADMAGGGRAEAGRAAAVTGVAKILGSAKVPFDGRAYAARTLGQLGGTAGLAALRRAVALPAGKEQSLVARSCAQALVTLKDAQGGAALAKAIGTWTSFYESKEMSDAMRFSDWRRTTRVLGDLIAAWAALAAPESKSTFLDHSVVSRVFAPQHKVQTSSRVPQDPSGTRRAMAEAVAKAYKRTNASPARWDKLLAALENDEKAKGAAASVR